jgi:hypothetical protein
MNDFIQVKGNGPFQVIESDKAIAGYTAMSREAYSALAAAYVSEPISTARYQSGATVIRRLTDEEVVALDASRHPAAIRAKMLAQSEGVISEADPDYAALTGALDALGIIDLDRWTELLAL